jgi:hypothetical protein
VAAHLAHQTARRLFVARRLQAPARAHDVADVGDPHALLRPRHGVLGQQLALLGGLVEVLQDDRALEQRRLVDLEHRDLAQGRDRQEPVRPIPQVDVGDVVVAALLLQEDGGALDERAGIEAERVSTKSAGGRGAA